MYSRILVPLDGSAFAEAALPTAVAIAGKTGAELRLLRVRGRPTAFALADHGRFGGAEGYLFDTARRIRFDKLTTVVRDGAFAERIRSEANEWGADLIVMATHGRGPLSRVWSGSVANECLRGAPWPVLLVRPESNAANQLAPWDIHQIVVPLDGSEAAEGALGHALPLARMLGIPTTLVRAVSQTRDRDGKIEARDETDAVRSLDALASTLRVRDPDTTWRVIAGRTPAAAVLDQADDHGLIVMTTHARGGLERLLMGSVAEEIVRGLHGPALLIPPGAIHPDAHTLN